MNHYLISVKDSNLIDVLAQIIEVDFDLSLEQAKLLIRTRVIEHLLRFKNETKLVIERGYVDRVYRDYAMLSDMGTNLKDIILNKSLPRYVWVTEISDNMSIGQNHAKGLVLLDATEANASDFRPLIFALCNGSLVQYDKKHKAFVSSQEKIEPFTMYESSLKCL